MKKPTLVNEELNVSIDFFNHNGDWYINFKVNNSFDKIENNANKVAITKWLLKSWNELKIRHKGKTVYCEPYKEDGHSDYRFNVYKKLGFLYEDKNTMVIEL